VEDVTMSFSRFWLGACALSVLVGSSSRADDGVKRGDKVGEKTPPAVDVRTYTFVAPANEEAEMKPVLFGRFRPFWRGSQNAAMSFAARPTTANRQASPATYAFGPVHQASNECVCPVTAAVGITPATAQSAAPGNGGRNDAGSAAPSLPQNGARPAETVEPPLAAAPIKNGVKAMSWQVPPALVAVSHSK
jgi:hypothetical protein